MSTNQHPGASSAPKEQVPDGAVLKVVVPLTLRRAVKAKATIDGVSMGEVVTELLSQAMEVKPSDEQILSLLLRRRLPHPLFSHLENQVKANRSTWLETVQVALAGSTQAPIQKPMFSQQIPRPGLKTQAKGFLDLPVRDTTIGEDVDVRWEDSGVRSSATG